MKRSKLFFVMNKNFFCLYKPKRWIVFYWILWGMNEEIITDHYPPQSERDFADSKSFFFIQQVPNARTSRSASNGSRTGTVSRMKIPHTFQVHTYTRPTVCQYCKKLLRGLFKQGVQCNDCHYNVHKKCVEFVPKDCESKFQVDVNGEVGGMGSERESMLNDAEDSDFDEATFNSNFNGANRENVPPSSMAKINGNKLEVLDDNFDAISEQSRHSE